MIKVQLLHMQVNRAGQPFKPLETRDQVGKDHEFISTTLATSAIRKAHLRLYISVGSLPLIKVREVQTLKNARLSKNRYKEPKKKRVNQNSHIIMVGHH